MTLPKAVLAPLLAAILLSSSLLAGAQTLPSSGDVDMAIGGTVPTAQGASLSQSESTALAHSLLPKPRAFKGLFESGAVEEVPISQDQTHVAGFQDGHLPAHVYTAPGLVSEGDDAASGSVHQDGEAPVDPAPGTPPTPDPSTIPPPDVEVAALVAQLLAQLEEVEARARATIERIRILQTLQEAIDDIEPMIDERRLEEDIAMLERAVANLRTIVTQRLEALAIDDYQLSLRELLLVVNDLSAFTDTPEGKPLAVDGEALTDAYEPFMVTVAQLQRRLPQMTISSALQSLGPMAAAGESMAMASSGYTYTYVRDDDGTKEAELDLDYGDDTAIKTLNVPSGSYNWAYLWVYGRADACGTVGSNQRLLVNGYTITDYNPCNYWSTTSSGWAGFSIPLSYLSPGYANQVEFYEHTGSWGDRNVFLGIDQWDDNGRSVARKDGGSDIYGELMVYLELESGGGTDYPPSACFYASPTSGTTSTTFYFDAYCSSDDYTPFSSLQFRWDYNNDGAFEVGWGSSSYVATSYGTTGTRTVRLQVRDGMYQVSDYYVSVSVSTPDSTAPYACFNVSPGTGTTSTAFAFDASCTSDNVSPLSSIRVQWDWTSDGYYDTSLSYTKTASRTFTAAGTYTIRMAAQDAAGNWGTTTRTVSVSAPNAPPTACFSVTPSSPRVGQAVAFSAACTYDDQTPHASLQYRWDFQGDGWWDTPYTYSDAASHTYTSSADHYANLQVMDGAGLTQTAWRMVRVANAPPTACLRIDNAEQMYTQQFRVDASCSTDDQTSSLQFRFDWNNDGTWETSRGYTPTATHYYAGPGEYDVKVEVTDGHGASSTTTVHVMAGNQQVTVHLTDWYHGTMDDGTGRMVDYIDRYMVFENVDANGDEWTEYKYEAYVWRDPARLSSSMVQWRMDRDGNEFLTVTFKEFVKNAPYNSGTAYSGWNHYEVQPTPVSNQEMTYLTPVTNQYYTWFLAGGAHYVNGELTSSTSFIEMVRSNPTSAADKNGQMNPPATGQGPPDWNGMSFDPRFKSHLKTCETVSHNHLPWESGGHTHECFKVEVQVMDYDERTQEFMDAAADAYQYTMYLKDYMESIDLVDFLRKQLQVTVLGFVVDWVIAAVQTGDVFRIDWLEKDRAQSTWFGTVQWAFTTLESVPPVPIIPWDPTFLGHLIPKFWSGTTLWCVEWSLYGNNAC